MIDVLIVDDSAVVRQVLREILSRDPEIRVIGAAADPLFALKRMRERWPDVVVLDIEMPRMDGLTFLGKIMAERATPVLICSNLTQWGAASTMQALAGGAVGVVAKPRAGLRDFLEGVAGDITYAVKAAARANIANLRHAHAAAVHARPPGDAPPVRMGPAPPAAAARVVAIGASTGGIQALELVLSALPATAPGIVVVQHMPEGFTGSFAQRLDSLCGIHVKEAMYGDRVLRGQALIAPGGRHMRLRRSGEHYAVEVFDGPLVNRHKPSVDVLFRSAAESAGTNALGVILTGMGDDGARGLMQMREAGATTIAQDRETCVVFGMPKEAIARGAAGKVMPLDRIPAEIMHHAAGESAGDRGA